MQLSAAARSITLSVREFAEFTTGPMRWDAGGFDLERAQIGVTWHEELRERATATEPTTQFEVPLKASFVSAGWTIHISGRIDQVARIDDAPLVREVKTVMRPLPAPADTLRDDYRSYFAQLATYQCLHGLDGAPREHAALPGELVFVEPPTGFIQRIAQTPDEAWTIFGEQLERIRNFAELRLSGLERLRHLSFAPAFAEPRPGQETILEDLQAAALRSPLVCFEAPTGYGKTGCALEYALRELHDGRLTRILYLTGKSTGQLQVVRQLEAMVGQPPGATWWQIRNKSEHCINDTYHCFRDTCRFLNGQEARWPTSGLQRFAQDVSLPRDIETLREAGREATICPYEITRATLPFTDIWIADYNYVFAPRNRSFLADLTGFEPEHTLLIVDEAHNLPSRVADAFSCELSEKTARAALAALDATGAPPKFVAAWERLVLFLARIDKAEVLEPMLEAELLDHLGDINRLLPESSLDYPTLGPAASDTVFLVASLHTTSEEETRALPELIWAPARGVIAFTCLDASSAIAETLHDFGHALFLSATLSPIDIFGRLCGFDRLGVRPEHLVAPTPWRDAAYNVAVDARVDTRYAQRARYFGETAGAIAAMHAAGDGPVVAFFPSYAYAERVWREVEAQHPEIRAVMQPRVRQLIAQQSFLEEALAFSDVILLVLGSSYAEGIDLLGGRVSGAVVVGPALPEVNAVQRARLEASRAANRSEAFREVYQIPGMQKVNQALGRLVRAPGQRARVLLHCRRFAEGSYQTLLAPEYRASPVLATREEMDAWLRET